MTFPIFSLWCLTPYSTMFHRWVSENGLRPNLCLGFSSGNSGMDHESNDVKFMVKLKVLVSLCPRAPVSPLRRLARGRQCNWQICSKKRRSWELRGTLVITWNHMGGFPKIWVPLGTPKSSINYYFMFFSKDNPFFWVPPCMETIIFNMDRKQRLLHRFDPGLYTCSVMSQLTYSLAGCPLNE